MQGLMLNLKHSTCLGHCNYWTRRAAACIDKHASLAVKIFIAFALELWGRKFFLRFCNFLWTFDRKRTNVIYPLVEDIKLFFSFHFLSEKISWSVCFRPSLIVIKTPNWLLREELNTLVRLGRILSYLHV